MYIEVSNQLIPTEIFCKWEFRPLPRREVPLSMHRPEYVCSNRPLVRYLVKGHKYMKTKHCQPI